MYRSTYGVWLHVWLLQDRLTFIVVGLPVKTGIPEALVCIRIEHMHTLSHLLRYLRYGLRLTLVIWVHSMYLCLKHFQCHDQEYLQALSLWL